jgi:2-aminoadipate transaminase
MGSSAIREILKITQQPDVISFAGGLPAPEIFPVEEFRQACDRVLENQGPQSLQYSPTEGYPPLRDYLVRYSAKMGIEVTTENVLITSGSQQALDLIGKIFINPGDRILVESPTYLGAIQAWSAYGAEYVSVPMDDNGMVTDALEEALRCGPKFIYVLPNFQNPTGVTLAGERREKIVELADHYGVPIVEDDPYGQLRFDGSHLPSIISLDGKFHGSPDPWYSGNVVYLSTFSKILAPGIRLAWVIAPPDVIRKLVQAKQGADLHTATFNQVVAYEVARDDFIERHILRIREVYGERRDIMLGAMDGYFPPGANWTHPQGGLFLWGWLPENLDTTQILSEAVARKVAYVPGAPFFPDGGGHNTMRLNFSNATPEDIQDGISRLGKLFHEKLS